MKKFQLYSSFRIALPLFFAVIIYALAQYGWERPREESSSLGLGRPAPDFTLQNFSLSSLRGQPILLHFWATWCGPCLKELPELAQLAPGLKKQGVKLVAVAVERNARDVEAFLRRDPALKDFQQDFIVLLDSEGEAAAAFSSQQFPETFLINRQFLVDNKFIGAQPWQAKAVRDLLERFAK